MPQRGFGVNNMRVVNRKYDFVVRKIARREDSKTMYFRVRNDHTIITHNDQTFRLDILKVRHVTVS